jgi:hypothetical protein
MLHVTKQATETDLLMVTFSHGSNLTLDMVAGLVSDEVIGFFNWPNYSSRAMALG